MTYRIDPPSAPKQCARRPDTIVSKQRLASYQKSIGIVHTHMIIIIAHALEENLVRFVAVLLEILLKLLCLAMSNLNRANRRIISLLQFDRPISDVFALKAMPKLIK